MKRILIIGALIAAALGIFAGSAAADSGTWACRASTLTLVVGTGAPIEPLVANGPNAPCQGAGAGATPAPAAGISLDGAFARTTVDASRPTNGQAPTSEAGVVGSNTDIAPVSGLDMKVGVFNSQVGGSCLNQSPVFTQPKSNIANVNVNGVPLPTPLLPYVTLLTQVANQTGVLVLNFNEPTQTSTSLEIAAAHLRVAGVGGPILDLKLGVSSVGFTGNPCANPSPPSCPAGSVYDGGSGACVITQPAACTAGTVRLPNGSCLALIVVGAANQNSTSSVVPVGRLSAAQKAQVNRYCGGFARYRGVALVGDPHRHNRIVGTKGNDIIFAGGGDTISGGAGNDCLLGARGNDHLDGGPGNDIMVGGGGNNNLFDTAGNNRFYGGSGRDFITSGAGHDIVRAGTGRDVIDAARFGKANDIYCHRGRRDVVRVDVNEIHHLHGCDGPVFLVVRRGETKLHL